MRDVESSPHLYRWINRLFMIAIIMVIAVATIASGEAWAIVGGLLGLAGAWLLTALVGASRRRQPSGVGMILVGVAVLGITAAIALVTQVLTDNAPSPERATDYLVTMPYHATGQMDGTKLVLREELTLDDDFNRAIDVIFGPLTSFEDTDQMRQPEGWAWDHSGAETKFVRTRTVAPDRGLPLGNRLTIALDLGVLPVRGSSVSLGVRDGSQIVLTTAPHALGATAPAAPTTDVRSEGSQVTTITVGHDTAGVTLVALIESFRNPAGLGFYRAAQWWGLPWVIGIMVALFGSVLWDRLLRRLAPRQRSTTPRSRAAPRTDVITKPAAGT